jgi:hypothetical protein
MRNGLATEPVVPAKAGTQWRSERHWIPSPLSRELKAAGMTVWERHIGATHLLMPSTYRKTEETSP